MPSDDGGLRERLPIDDVRERADDLYARSVSALDRGWRSDAREAIDAIIPDDVLEADRTGAPDDAAPSRRTDERREQSNDQTDADPIDTDSTDTDPTGTDPAFDFRGWLAEGADEAVTALDATSASTTERQWETTPARTSTDSAVVDVAGFDFGAWVRTGDGDLEPIGEPAEPVEDPAEPVETPDVDDASAPVETPGETGGPNTAATTGPSEPPIQPDPSTATDRETPLRPAPVLDIHPVKAATLALFLAFVVLAVLSMVGYLPPLGPSTGLAS